MAREGFVHTATLDLGPDVDPAAVGAAVTTALCGHWEHPGPCTWPHNNAISSGAPAELRTVFVCEPADEAAVRARIEAALAGDDGWTVRSSGPRALAPDEEPLAERLAG